MFVRDMDLAVPGVPESRRLEVVVDGLPLRGGAQLALDTTLMCALHADGTPRRHAAQRDGVALQAAKRKKVATYPESLWCWRWRLAAVGLGRREGS